MDSRLLLSEDDLMKVPQELLPMPVLSDNLRSFFSFGIKAHEKGCYNHFMWMIEPGVFASQNFLYKTQPVSDYTGQCRLKLWCCRSWNTNERNLIFANIRLNLAKPWYKRIYDFPAILGQIFWHEFQTPGLSICSDYGHSISLVDPEYDLRFPDPEQVNHWLEARPNKYDVYGRYLPD